MKVTKKLIKFFIEKAISIKFEISVNLFTSEIVRVYLFILKEMHLRKILHFNLFSKYSKLISKE